MNTSNYPGTFGGPGVTGQMILQNLNTQPITAAGGAGGTAFGTGVSGSAFGSNAFSGGAANQGGMGAGGMNMGGMGGMGLGGVGGLGRGGMGLGGFGAGNFGMGMMGGNAQGRKPIRASVRPEIEMSARGSADLAARTTSRFTNLPAAQKFPNVNASYENGSVVLRGSVATEKDKKMMERLMKLEPGVDSVRNELLVQGPTLEQIPAMRNQ
ncbi:MAG: BON domain-containing protein [Planctomycetes bacterium]|nr:BON domain-containing protein [Planctomycetota bacterium]